MLLRHNFFQVLVYFKDGLPLSRVFLEKKKKKRKIQLGLLLWHRELPNPKRTQILMFQTFLETTGKFFPIWEKLLFSGNIIQNEQMVFHWKSYLDFNLKMQSHLVGEIHVLTRIIFDLLFKLPQSKKMEQCLLQREDMHPPLKPCKCLQIVPQSPSFLFVFIHFHLK